MMSQSMERCKVSESCQHHAAHHCQRRLISVLLVWVSILTISLGVSIIVHFIDRPHHLPPCCPDPNPTPDLTPITVQSTLQEPRMLTFECAVHSGGKKVNVIQWKQENEANVIEGLTIKEDGCYFIYVHVTLQTPKEEKREEESVVKVVDQRNRVLLERRLSNSTLTTGFLGRALQLSESNFLNVTISPPSLINTTDTATYMGFFRC